MKISQKLSDLLINFNGKNLELRVLIEGKDECVHNPNDSLLIRNKKTRSFFQSKVEELRMQIYSFGGFIGETEFRNFSIDLTIPIKSLSQLENILEVISIGTRMDFPYAFEGYPVGQIVRYPAGQGGKQEYGVIIKSPDTVRWDSNKKDDFEYGFPFSLDEIDDYTFKFINQDGTYPRTK